MADTPAYKYDEKGNLLVWTGSGYHMIPVLGASDVSNYQHFTPYTSHGDASLPGGLVDDPNYVATGGDSDSGPQKGTLSTQYQISDPAKWGLPADPDNWRYEGGDENTLTYTLKSADKEGTRIQFVKQPDGTWKPTYSGAEYWDTNNSEQNMALGMIAAAPFLTAGLQELTGLAGTPFQPGVYGPTIDASLGMLGGGAVAAAPAAGAAAEEALTMLPAQGNPVIAAPAAGAPSMLTPGVAGAGTVAAGTVAGGATAGLPASVVSVIESVLGPGAASTLAPEVLKAIAGAVTSGISNNNAQDAVEESYQNKVAAAGDYKTAYDTYAKGLEGLIPGLKDAYAYKPATVNNGFATTSVDPATGRVSYALNPEYQTAKDYNLGAAQHVRNQIWMNDPQSMATNRYNAAQALLAPGDEQTKQGLLQDLYNKGGYGLTTNVAASATPAPGGGVTPGQGSVGVNPYVSTYLNSLNQRNAGMSYNSLREGEAYLDNLIGRERGLFNTAAGIDREGGAALGLANQWGNTFSNAAQQQGRMLYNANVDVLGANRDGVTRYIDSMLNAQNTKVGQNAISDASRDDKIYDTVTGLNWGDIWEKLKGLFGSGS